jgi:hypothetical protein
MAPRAATTCWSPSTRRRHDDPRHAEQLRHRQDPWGTLLTGEENWAGYFTRNANDDTARGNDKSVTSLNRYGRNQGAASRHGWEGDGAGATTSTRAGTSA